MAPHCSVGAILAWTNTFADEPERVWVWASDDAYRVARESKILQAPSLR